ncbi:hypothetical protein R1sor_024835 [Riccia sorocarpa]|uniref:Chlororespiratory reduction 6 n=1 Tax=Riccia sorocarpa TaxID=122646 RepID=A0ABD3GVL4_9MARC
MFFGCWANGVLGAARWAQRRAARAPAAPRMAARPSARPASQELDLAAPRRALRLCAEPRDSAAPRKAAAINAALRRAAESHAALRRATEVSSEMTFTRKTGRVRHVENEATVEVEVTRPKRHVKKPVAAADLPSTSQRIGKKRVHEGFAGIDDAKVVVKKERSCEDPWLIKRYFKVDVISNVQWAYIKPDDISTAFAGISEFQIRRLGLRGVITRQYIPPNVPLCKEWLLSFDGAPKRDCSATV